jgi:predicted transcriptional regulator
MGLSRHLVLWKLVPKLRLSCQQYRFGNPSHRAFLICLDDGKKLKTLKRHLTNLGMTPDQYRAKWGLPDNYPMVAPEYAATRSTLAKKSGFGQTAKQKSGRTSKAVVETAAS